MRIYYVTLVIELKDKKKKEKKMDTFKRYFKRSALFFTECNSLFN